jgi:hypothetical protein
MHCSGQLLQQRLNRPLLNITKEHALPKIDESVRDLFMCFTQLFRTNADSGIRFLIDRYLEFEGCTPSARCGRLHGPKLWARRSRRRRRKSGFLELATKTSCPERSQAAGQRSVDLASADNAYVHVFILSVDGSTPSRRINLFATYLSGRYMVQGGHVGALIPLGQRCCTFIYPKASREQVEDCGIENLRAVGFNDGQFVAIIAKCPQQFANYINMALDLPVDFLSVRFLSLDSKLASDAKTNSEHFERRTRPKPGVRQPYWPPGRSDPLASRRLPPQC